MSRLPNELLVKIFDYLDDEKKYQMYLSSGKIDIYLDSFYRSIPIKTLVYNNLSSDTFIKNKFITKLNIPEMFDIINNITGRVRLMTMKSNIINFEINGKIIEKNENIGLYGPIKLKLFYGKGVVIDNYKLKCNFSYTSPNTQFITGLYTYKRYDFRVDPIYCYVTYYDINSDYQLGYYIYTDNSQKSYKFYMFRKNNITENK